STRSSPAWKALSYGARCTYVELRAFYSLQKENAVWLSCRDGAKALGTKNVTRVAEWIRELQFYGFIVPVSGGALGSEGEGFSLHYRLTEACYLGHEATRDFEQWDGVKFKRPKPTNVRVLRPARRRAA